MNFAAWNIGDWIANGALAVAALGILLVLWDRWLR